MSYKEDLIQIVKEQDWLIDLLKATRELQLPDWYIAAGTIRNTVWNVLHCFQSELHQNDVDVVYFDSSDVSGKKTKGYERRLRESFPKREWEVVNQAGAHLMNCNKELNRMPAKSSCEAIAYWSETATSVGIRLEEDNSFTIGAPHSFDDLMNLIVRPVPKPYQALQLYERRVREKKWQEIWPKLTILHTS